MYKPRSFDATTVLSSPVTQGKMNAVPMGISVNPMASTGYPVASPVAARPNARMTTPSRDSRTSPSRSTIRPSRRDRTSTPIPPRYITK